MAMERPSEAEAASNGTAPRDFWFDGVGIPVFAVDTLGNVTAWNQKAGECTGLFAGKVRSFPLTSFIAASHQQAWIEALNEGLARKGERICEVSFSYKDAVTSTFRVRIAVHESPHGEIVGAVCIMEEIMLPSSRSSAAANHESTARELSQLIETANLPIFGVDTGGNVTLWNQKISEISGFALSEITGESMFGKFTVPSFQHSVRSVLESALKGKETSNYELEFQSKAGDIRYFLANVMTRRDVNDQVIGAVLIAQDVTEAAQHDRAVAGMAQELRQLVDTANAAIFGVDDTGKVNEWNDKTAEITGYGVEEAFSKQFVDTFIAPEHQVAVHSVLNSALKGRGTTNFELEIYTRSNEVRYLLVNAETRRDAENKIVGVVAIAQDVTEASKHDRAVAAMASELRQLIDTANAPIFGIDCDGYVKGLHKCRTLLYTRILTRFPVACLQ